MGVILEHSIAELGYTQRIMNKILLAIAMFGAVQATPEADPAVLYGGYYGYGLGHYGYGYPFHAAYYGHAGAVQAGLPYANGWTDGPNNGVDPAVLYGGYYGYGGLGYYGLGHYGYGYPYAGYYASHYGAVQAGLPYANGWTDGPNNGLGPVYGRKKREAEADPAVLYGGYYGYGGLGYYGYRYPYYAGYY